MRFVDATNDERYLVDKVVLTAIVLCFFVEGVMDGFMTLLTESSKRLMVQHELVEMTKHGVLFWRVITIERIVIDEEHAGLTTSDIITAKRGKEAHIELSKVVHTHAKAINRQQRLKKGRIAPTETTSETTLQGRIKIT